MRKVIYRATFQDWLVGYRVGMARMTPFYWAVWSGVFLLTMAGFLMMSWGKGYPTAFPSTTLPPRALISSLGYSIGVIFGIYVVTSVVGWSLTRRRIVRIQNQHLLNKIMFGWNTVSWRSVTDIVETAEHICFCQNVPTAVVVPKSAFRTQEQARIFLEQAKRYWREAKGVAPLPAPDVSGVWPPAPRATDFQELGETPKH